MVYQYVVVQVVVEKVGFLGYEVNMGMVFGWVYLVQVDVFDFYQFFGWLVEVVEQLQYCGFVVVDVFQYGDVFVGFDVQ